MKREKIEKFLKLSRYYPVFDVRSPAEYQKGHIPGAFNLPLVNNDERAEVGTLYVQQSKQAAYVRGLEIIGPKLHLFAKEAIAKSVEKKVLLYCWRGGQRSESLAWLFELLGLKAVVLEGGYRSFRTYVRSFFQTPFRFIVIGGYTGSGKTQILKLLEVRGEQVLDLEGLASHKGSAFGSIGMSSQPHYETFEIELFRKLSSFDPQRPIFVEDESKHVGRLLIPDALFDQIFASPLIIIERTMENRIERLRKDYTHVDKEVLIEAVDKIKKRLGPQRTKEVIQSIGDGDMNAAITEVLWYYDKAYGLTVDKRFKVQTNLSDPFRIQSDDDNSVVESILKYVEEVM